MVLSTKKLAKGPQYGSNLLLRKSRATISEHALL